MVWVALEAVARPRAFWRAIFADELRGEDVGASMKSPSRITDNSCQWQGHRWRGARSARRRREAARVGIVPLFPSECTFNRSEIR